MVKSRRHLIQWTLFAAFTISFGAFVLLNLPTLSRQSSSIYHDGSPSRTYHMVPQLTSGASGDALTDQDVTWMYRGNVHRQGYSNEILKNYQNMKVRWTSEEINYSVHRASKATPAVDDSGLYVGGDDGWFYAFDLDGKVRWKFFTSRTDNGIHGSAILIKDRVCFGSYNGFFYCLKKTNGEPIWIIRLAEAMGSSPTFFENDFFVSIETSDVNGYVARLNGTTGEIKWQSPWVGEQIHSSVTLDPEHRRVFVGANNGRMFAFHMDTGALLWTGDAGGAMKGTAAIADGKLFFSSWGSRFEAVDLTTMKPAWQVKIPGVSQSSPAIVPGSSLIGINYHGEKSGFVVYNMETGKVLWSHEIFDSKVLNLQSATAVRVSENEWAFLQMCEMNQLCLLRAQDGKVLKTWTVQGFMTGAPTVYKNNIFINMEYGSVIRLSAN